MQRSTHTWFSPALGQTMTLNTFGQQGKPVLVFPSQEGRYWEYEDFGMVEETRPLIEAGQVQLICVDSVDAQSWCNPHIAPRQRAFRHNDYERYILDEVLPFIRSRSGGHGLTLTGCSMGGYHAANFFFRHPDLADSLIALSGVYDLTLFIGDAMDDQIFYHAPLAYLPGLTDGRYIEQYRKAHIVLCVGQGDWEEPMLTQTRQMADILRHHGVPAQVDVWGYDVSHDWPWWRRQIGHFLPPLVR